MVLGRRRLLPGENEEARVQVSKNVIVREMFVRTADDNYIVARWCLFERLDADFCWLAVHALEKYLKAVLLLNGHSSKKESKSKKDKEYGHDIIALYRKVERSIAQEFLVPLAFEKPAEWRGFWRTESPVMFLERLHQVGQPHNRYQVFGYERHSEDLLKLDVVVFAIRRLCRCLELRVYENLTNRDVLRRSPRDWSLQINGRLEQVIRGEDMTLRDAACLLNVPFAPPDYEQPNGFVGMTMRRSALYTEILRPAVRTPEDRAVVGRLVDWARENIKLPKDVEEQLRAKVGDSDS